MSEPVRLHVYINEEAASAIREMQEAEGTNATNIINSCIGTHYFFWKAQREGKTIVLQYRDRLFRRLERTVFVR